MDSRVALLRGCQYVKAMFLKGVTNEDGDEGKAHGCGGT
jgi:hypothetical protein